MVAWLATGQPLLKCNEGSDVKDHSKTKRTTKAKGAKKQAAQDFRLLLDESLCYHFCESVRNEIVSMSVISELQLRALAGAVPNKVVGVPAEQYSFNAELIRAFRAELMDPLEAYTNERWQASGGACASQTDDFQAAQTFREIAERLLELAEAGHPFSEECANDWSRRLEIAWLAFARHPLVVGSANRLDRSEKAREGRAKSISGPKETNRAAVKKAFDRLTPEQRRGAGATDILRTLTGLSHTTINKHLRALGLKAAVKAPKTES